MPKSSIKKSVKTENLSDSSIEQTVQEKPKTVTNKKIIFEDVDENDDLTKTEDIFALKKTPGIYEFTKQLLENAELPIQGKIKYLCCSNPWLIDFKDKRDKDSNSYKIVPLHVIYENGEKKCQLSYSKLIESIDEPVFIANVVNNDKPFNKKKLSKSSLETGFIIQVELIEREFKGNKYFRYGYTTNFGDSTLNLIKGFADKYWKDLNEKYNYKPLEIPDTDDSFGTDLETFNK
jgi:hypothetical protein